MLHKFFKISQTSTKSCYFDIAQDERVKHCSIVFISKNSKLEKDYINRLDKKSDVEKKVSKLKRRKASGIYLDNFR